MSRALCAVSLVCLVVAAPARAASYPVPVSSVQAPEGLHHVVVVGSYVYGITRGTDRLVNFKRAADGSLSPLSSATVPGSRELAASPDGRDLYVVAQDDEGTALAHYRLGADGSGTFAGCVGTRAQCTPGADFDQPSDLAVSPDGRDVYVLAAYRVVDFHRAADGSLTPAGCSGDDHCPAPYVSFDTPHAIAVSPNGRDVYTTDGYDTVLRPSKVEHFTRAADGSLHYADCIGADVPAYDPPCTPLPAGVVSTSGPLGLAISPDGRSVYVSGGTSGVNQFDGTDAVTHFSVAGDGSLRFSDCIGDGPSGCPGLPGGTFALRYPRSLAIGPDGSDLYTSAIVDGTITHFALAAGGALSFASCAGSSPSPRCLYTDFGGVNAQRVTVSPDGLNLYAPGSSRLFTFGLQSTPPAPTGTPPTVTLRDPEYLGQFSVQLRARVVPKASSWTSRFEYGRTAAYDTYANGGSESDDGDGFYLDTTLRDLAPGTTYHYRLAVMSPAGVAYSPDATFTTLPYDTPGAPDVETMGALGNAGTAAALAATVRPAGASTTYRFQWGETTALGNETPTRALENDNADHSVTELLSGLTPGTGYYFRVAATNAGGTAYGLLRKFTAATAPPAAATPTPTPTPSPTATPSPSVPAAERAVQPAAVKPAAAQISRLTLRHTRHGFAVTYRDTAARSIVLTIHRGSQIVRTLRRHSRPGRNTIRCTLRRGSYRIVLRPSGGVALTRRLTVR